MNTSIHADQLTFPTWLAKERPPIVSYDDSVIKQTVFGQKSQKAATESQSKINVIDEIDQIILYCCDYG